MSFVQRFLHSAYLPSARSVLLVSLGLLLLISLMMIASTSIPFAMGRENTFALKYVISQASYLLLAVMLGALAYKLPFRWYYERPIQAVVWGGIFLLLISTLLFGEGINGAKRWVSVAGFSFQPAEFAKMMIVPIVASYMARETIVLRYGNILRSLVSVLSWYFPIMLALLFQPDFGSVVVIGATIFVMFFVGGAPFFQYLILIIVAFALGLIGLASADYRLSRISTFLHPFEEKYINNETYQLARSLIAFGRGEFSGVGYGNSIQKLEHLPEAHTDFLLPILGEEFGFLGVFTVIALEFLIIGAIMRISYKALAYRQLKLSYTAFGFGVVLFGHVLINAGMTLGLLPTKGLTMPFFSYGGSSLLVCVIMVAIVLKIDAESPTIASRGESRQY